MFLEEDYGQIERFLTGECGIPLSQVPLLTYREYLHRISCYHHRNYEQQMQQLRDTRLLIFHMYLLSPYIKPQHKPRAPEDVFRLDGEEPQIARRSEEERRKDREFWQKRGFKLIN